MRFVPLSVTLVSWGNQSFTYDLPTKTAATFTWTGTPGNGGGATGGQITDGHDPIRVEHGCVVTPVGRRVASHRR